LASRLLQKRYWLESTLTTKSKMELSAAILHIKNAAKKVSFIENLWFQPERNQSSFS
tara:strand:+ start:117 stop:287 length:171 start_codon:yes stop_codon:yes gene_type:complete